MIPVPAAAVKNIKEDIHDLIGDQRFDSIEEALTVLDQYQQQKNEDSVDDFQGQSSEQMHRFLHMASETSGLVTFPLVLERAGEQSFQCD
jgi:hypothetical protein